MPKTTNLYLNVYSLPEPLQIALGMVIYLGIVCIEMALYALVIGVPFAIFVLILYWLVH